MPKVLILDDDPFILRLAATTLERAGHHALATDQPQRALEAARNGEVDAAILDVMMPGMNGLDVITALRQDPATSELPVLMLSSLSGGDDRVRALERGADDYLEKPCSPRELVLRVSRLLDRRVPREADLSGQLALVSVPEVLQTLQHAEASGTLEVDSGLCRGAVDLDRGRAVSARFGSLEGREAVLAMFEHETGQFRFVRRLETDTASVATDLPIQNLMFEAAWLRDELARRPGPEADAELIRQPELDVSPDAPEEFATLPFQRVWDALELEPGLTVAELESRIHTAPGMVRLAVAVMMEQGTVVARPDDEDDGSSVNGLGAAARAFVTSAREVRGDETMVQVLLVADDGVVGDLLAMRQEIPQHLMSAPGDSLMGAWRAGRIASLPLDAGGTTLLLQMAPERDDLRTQITDAARGAAAVVVWSHDGSAPSRLDWLLEAVETTQTTAWGVVVVPDRTGTFRAALTTNGLEHWSIAQLRPTDLATFLRAVRAAAPATPDDTPVEPRVEADEAGLPAF